jgi:hypothetical protein
MRLSLEGKKIPAHMTKALMVAAGNTVSCNEGFSLAGVRSED